MIGAPVRAWTIRQNTTSVRVSQKPSMVDDKTKHTSDPIINCLAPKRAAIQGQGGVPMASATTLAVTIHDTWSRLADKSPCMLGRTTLAIVEVLPNTAPAQVTLKKIDARLSAAPGALYSGVSETSVATCHLSFQAAGAEQDDNRYRR